MPRSDISLQQALAFLGVEDTKKVSSFCIISSEITLDRINQTLILITFVYHKMNNKDVKELSSSDLNILRNLRGLVLAYDNKTNEFVGIVQRGMRYTPRVVTTAIREKMMCDNGDECPEITPETTFLPRKEGCMLRVASWHDYIIVSTNKKLDIANSRWVTGKLFHEMWEECRAPEFHTLFPQGVRKDVTHCFILVHPHFQMGSRNPIGSGYVAYIGSVTNDVRGTIVSALPEDMVQTSKDLYFCPRGDFSGFYMPSPLSAQEVASILKGREAAHPLFSEGFSVVANIPGEFPQTVLFESPACAWRRIITGNNPNFAQQVANLITRASSDPKNKRGNPWDKFEPQDEQEAAGIYTEERICQILSKPPALNPAMALNQIPTNLLFPPFLPTNIKDVPTHYDPRFDDVEYKLVDFVEEVQPAKYSGASRLMQLRVLLCLVLATPPSRASEAAQARETFTNIKGTVTKFFKDNMENLYAYFTQGEGILSNSVFYKKKSEPNAGLEAIERILGLAMSAYSRAPARSSRHAFNESVEASLAREWGSTLYSMYSVINKYNQAMEEKPHEQREVYPSGRFIIDTSAPQSAAAYPMAPPPPPSAASSHSWRNEYQAPAPPAYAAAAAPHPPSPRPSPHPRMGGQGGKAEPYQAPHRRAAPPPPTYLSAAATPYKQAPPPPSAAAKFVDLE